MEKLSEIQKNEDKIIAKARKGSIVKRDGKINARVQFTDDSGKKRDFWRKAENQKYAKELIENLLKVVEAAGGKQLDCGMITLAELADHYIKNYLQPAVYVGNKKVSGIRGVEEALYAVKPLVQHSAIGKSKQLPTAILEITNKSGLPLRPNTENKEAFHR